MASGALLGAIPELVLFILLLPGAVTGPSGPTRWGFVLAIAAAGALAGVFGGAASVGAAMGRPFARGALSVVGAGASSYGLYALPSSRR